MGFKQKTVDPGARKDRLSHPPKAEAVRDGAQRGPTIVSIGMELIVAVGMNLLKRHVKTWGSEINAERIELAAPKKASSSETLRTCDPIVQAISDEVKRQNPQPPRGAHKERIEASKWHSSHLPGNHRGIIWCQRSVRPTAGGA